MNIHDEAQRLRQRLEALQATKVRIALFGQPGAGKSSLINAICDAEIAKVGVRTDTTTEARSFEHEGLFFVDLPGYDTKQFPKETFWKKFDIVGFDLFLCVFDGKFHEADVDLFRELEKAGKVTIFVRNKHDQLWNPGRTTADLERETVEDVHRQTAQESVRVFFTSCRTRGGIDQLENAVAASLNAAKAERWRRSAAAYSQEALDAKHDACGAEIAVAAGLSAVNAFNPIPGVDISVDLGILASLFVRLRHNYGLSTERLSMAEAIPAVAPVAQDVAAAATKEGLILLLKRFAGREMVKVTMKWIPLVGQVVAASVGFGLTYSAGRYYNDKCYEVANAILTQELRQRAV